MTALYLKVKLMIFQLDQGFIRISENVLISNQEQHPF
jgi:hypothetical protein